MIAIEMRFIAGKYHATPWSRQVNEGAVEWPPSPWRILRALLATWHYKFPEVPEAEVRQLLLRLSPTPNYGLPLTSAGHTRHYMPATNDAKTKIFDTFIGVNRNAPLFVCWPDIALVEQEESLLRRLVTALNYFGRAESWVEADVRTDADVTFNARPLDENGVGNSQQLVRLLALDDSDAYLSWRDQTLAKLKQQKLDEKRRKAADKGKPVEKEKLTPKDIATIEALLPLDTFDALHAETDKLRKAGWNRPPASKWIEYVCDLPQSIGPAARSEVSSALPMVARYAIAGAVRPRLTEALWIGERARSYLMGCSKKENGGHCSEVFSGKSIDGTPKGEGSHTHTHSHYLAESLGPNSRGRITHLTVYAPAGFEIQDEAALSRLVRMHGSDGHDLQLVLLGVGDANDFGGTDERKGESPALASSRIWVSRTPFVPTDHLRIRQHERRDPESFAAATDRELDRLVRKELCRRPWLAQHADSVAIERTLDTSLGGTKTTWLKFRRERKRGGGKQSTTHGYGFRLIFAKAVQGPILLGFGSHFGLGQFIASESIPSHKSDC